MILLIDLMSLNLLLSRIMMKWLKAMSIRLDRLIVWRHRDSLQKTMPNCFRVSIGNRVTVILDCFEVFIECRLISKLEHTLGHHTSTTILSRCFLVLHPKVLKVFTKNGMYYHSCNKHNKVTFKRFGLSQHMNEHNAMNGFGVHYA